MSNFPIFLYCSSQKMNNCVGAPKRRHVTAPIQYWQTCWVKWQIIIVEMIGLKAGFRFLCTVTATWWLSLQVQSNPVNTDTKDAMESVHINRVSVLSRSLLLFKSTGAKY